VRGFEPHRPYQPTATPTGWVAGAYAAWVEPGGEREVGPADDGEGRGDGEPVAAPVEIGSVEVDVVEVVDLGGGDGGVVVETEVVEVTEVEVEAVREPSELDLIQDDLDAVEWALKALDDGSYGACQACGAAIADEVLATAPIARFCAEHQVSADV
jgi:hypothetical protein